MSKLRKIRVTLSDGLPSIDVDATNYYDAITKIAKKFGVRERKVMAELYKGASFETVNRKKPGRKKGRYDPDYTGPV